ncbi:hypothetical protein QJS10_CPB18g02092 [Acorus calamus]|uniref:Uncharacterized protein n=1 Tax=Acorus calamus TaxID=4465 RepID=A0AAV9CR89_ACOCL|nr:hypothetical protein QJS10_CPB18g02092 [Acorus calamus]
MGEVVVAAEMAAARGKKSKVAERDVEENNDHVDGDLVLSIEKLQEIQDELEKTSKAMATVSTLDLQRWRKAKQALGLNLNLCVYNPRTFDDASPSDDSGIRYSDASAASPATGSDIRPTMPSTPIPTSSGLRLSKTGSKSSSRSSKLIVFEGILSLYSRSESPSKPAESTKPGNGHAIFTAECSHTFHFHCIASNVKHGNRVCPVCRAKWKEIPFQVPPSSSDPPHGRSRINPLNWPPQDDSWMTDSRRLPARSDSSNRHNASSLRQPTEPSTFDDDEPLLDLQSNLVHESSSPVKAEVHSKVMEIKTYPEFSAVQRSSSKENFSVLINLKAPVASASQIHGQSLTYSSTSQASRTPVDLVTVLDISGSMAGTKLALLKRAMGFVIQNLGPSDRLSVIAFSSTARRIFPLRRMSESGRQQALQAVNSLISCGGTNIAEGLRKGAKVIEERQHKNPNRRPDYQSLLPFSSVRGSEGTIQIPVHAFGFGVDHDAASMHSISESSGGTFSFIEAEAMIQDAFAQCIGGLLSVVVQDVHVSIMCAHPSTHLTPIKSGSYPSKVSNDGRSGFIDAGDMYADEERDFLVTLNVPLGDAGGETSLLKVECVYKDPISKEMVNLEGEVAEAMAEARSAAERGNLSEAVSILEARRKALAESVAGMAGDRLCAALDAELREMQERMASRQRYEELGRAYVLAGLSSHSWQRATTRGDSTDSTSLVLSYQTPSMVNMLARSQTVSPTSANRRSNPPVRPARSFQAKPQPR